ncbi:MAG: AAA family ATPase [Cyanobacteria bacterium P01_A01_bin.123]
MDLFDQHRQTLLEKEAPLAARMRPRTLDEFVGQGAIVGPGRLLRRAIEADQLSSLIFYGPPGTGKTTLARVIANTTRAHFIAINAVLAGVKDIREAIASAQDRRGQFGQRTILFVDEVHRFNKAQQDALLPWVENGTVILIGATTENPYFEVNKALVSRSRVFQLKPLEDDDLRAIAHQALTDPERGYGDHVVSILPDALDHLVNVANGDARGLLNALELAVETTPVDDSGAIAITLTVAEESIQQRAVLYDKEGDAHFDTISAFIKSIRGSDPDAALYWLARMLYAGENPRFIFRRLVILASEDVGLADPHAVTVATSCAESFDRVGMPEGRYPLAQATLYLATAPKSNSVMAFFDALAAVEQEREADVPNPMKDGNRDKKGFGHGAGYLYPHAYRDHWVAQQYLPTALQGQVFYQPSDQGYEDSIRVQVARRREAQLAAILEGGGALPEGLTSSPDNPGQERWLQRALGQAGTQLAYGRDRLFATLQPQRHHVILDVNAGSGLLTWEALRQVPEGGVYAAVHRPQDAAALVEQAAQLPELNRPIVMQADLNQLDQALEQQAKGVRFDWIIGRNALTQVVDKATVLQQWINWLQPTGAIALVESIPRQAQRLYQLLNPDALPAALYQTVVIAEESIYQDPNNPMVNWDAADLKTAFETAGLTVQLTVETPQTEVLITPRLFNHWFSASGSGKKLTYRDRLSAYLNETDLKTVETTFKRYLLNQTVLWQSQIAFIRGDRNETKSI